MSREVGPKVTIRKYLGDDLYSWAVFVDGMPKVVGLSRDSASYYAKRFKSGELK